MEQKREEKVEEEKCREGIKNMKEKDENERKYASKDEKREENGERCGREIGRDGQDKERAKKEKRIEEERRKLKEKRIEEQKN